MSKWTERPAYSEWLTRQAESHRNVQRQRKQDGLCLRCGGIRDDQYTTCSHCRQLVRQRANALNQRCRDNGICSICHQRKPDPGHIRCPICSKKRSPSQKAEELLRWRNRMRQEVQDAYGGKCVCCGETEPVFLEIDHVNGGGSQHRKTVPGGSGFYYWLKKNNYPKQEYQLLCRNCNYGKYRNGGVCPHQAK